MAYNNTFYPLTPSTASPSPPCFNHSPHHDDSNKDLLLWPSRHLAVITDNPHPHPFQGPQPQTGIKATWATNASAYSQAYHLPYKAISALGGDCQASPQPRSKPPLQCKWEGCTYTGHFTRESVLLRHIRLIHLNPRQFICPYDSRCKPFNRRDNLTEHVRRIHEAAE